jgi:hypothetical protein
MENKSGAVSRPWLAELENEGHSRADLRHISNERTARWCSAQDKATIAEVRSRLNRESLELKERMVATSALTALSDLLDRQAIVLGSLDALRERK